MPIWAQKGYLLDLRRYVQADLDEDIAAMKTKLGVDAYETAHNSGWELTLNEAVAFALVGKN